MLVVVLLVADDSRWCCAAGRKSVGLVGAGMLVPRALFAFCESRSGVKASAHGYGKISKEMRSLDWLSRCS